MKVRHCKAFHPCRPSWHFVLTDVMKLTRSGEWIPDDGKPGYAFSGRVGNGHGFGHTPYAFSLSCRCDRSRKHQHLNCVRRMAMDLTAKRFGCANGRDAEPYKPVEPIAMVKHVFLIRPGMLVQFRLPANLTQNEAVRIGSCLESWVIKSSAPVTPSTESESLWEKSMVGPTIATGEISRDNLGPFSLPHRSGDRSVMLDDESNLDDSDSYSSSLGLED